VLGDWLAASIPDMQNGDTVAFNGEDNSVGMKLAPAEQMPHFEGEDGILRSQSTALGKIG
jgi:hypothetical protein